MEESRRSDASVAPNHDSMPVVAESTSEETGPRERRAPAAQVEGRKPFGGFGLAVIALLATSLSLRSQIGPEQAAPDSEMAAKLSWLTRQAHRYEVVFAGSSYTYRGVDPRRVDSGLSARFEAVHSYNYAAAGTYGFETAFYATQLGDLPRPKRPRVLVMELYSLTAPYVIGVMPDNALSGRMIEYHDARTTLENLRVLAASRLAMADKIGIAGTHLLHFAYRIGNVGLAAQLLFGGERSQTSRRVGRFGGFPASFHGRRHHRRGFSQPDYEEELRSYQRMQDACSRSGQCGEMLEEDWAFRLRTATYLRGRGIDVVFMLPPVPYLGVLPYRAFCQRSTSPPCIDLSDLALHPELFAFDNRYDRGHLNDRGASRMSAALADALLELAHSGRVRLNEVMP